MCNNVIDGCDATEELNCCESYFCLEANSRQEIRSLNTFRAIVQFTSAHQTRRRQDCLVVSGGRCELGIADTPSTVCAAGSMHLTRVRLSLRLSVCLSVCLSLYVRRSVCSQPHTSLLWARPAGDIDRLLHGAQQCGGRLRAVPRYQRTYEAERRPVA